MTTLNPPADLSDATGHALVFDSGVGGLTIVDALRALCPKVRIDFAADTGFFPYGDKSDAALRARLPLVADALTRAVQPDVFVIACNTASTLALPEVRARLNIPVVGTVPAIKPAAKLTGTGTIGLLATPGTIRRQYTADLIREFAGDLTVHCHGTVELVALAEAVARGETPGLDLFVRAQAPLFDQDKAACMDVIVLACTHFPLVRAELQGAAPHAVTYIDSGDAIARQTARILLQRLRPQTIDDNRDARAFVTAPPADHADLVSIFRRYGFAQTQQVTVDPSDAAELSPAHRVHGS